MGKRFSFNLFCGYRVCAVYRSSLVERKFLKFFIPIDDVIKCLLIEFGQTGKYLGFVACLVLTS